MSDRETHLRWLLESRREELASAVTVQAEGRLAELLRQVDAALAQREGDWRLAGPRVEASVAPSAEESLEEAVRVCLEGLEPDALRALERDLEKAAVVQRALLPPATWSAQGWQVARLWEPLGAVSGDHVDIVAGRSATEPAHLFVGDVAGKGVAASLLQSHLYALFRSFTDPALDLGEILGRANTHLCEATTSAHYATLVGLRLHGDGRVELANAGHPRPLLADRRGVRPVEGSGLPLGLFCASGYAERLFELAAGDVLMFYTDGWTEAESDGEEYGIGRAAAALRRASDRPLPELLAACRQDLDEFLSGAPRADDLTLVAVRRVG